MTNYKITFAYQGTSFFGYQRQASERTVEGEFVKAISHLQPDVKVISAGRTDTGVHAVGQVISVSLDKAYLPNDVKRSLHFYLPDDIQVSNVELVDSQFHARFSATSRLYKYLFTPQVLPAYLQDYVTQVNFIPDINRVQPILESFKGTYDFENFRNLGSCESTTLRTILNFDLKLKIMDGLYSHEDVELWELTIEANSFLYKMVRNITGLLFEILSGKRNADVFFDMLEKKIKRVPFTLAPAKGLCLVQVKY